MDRLEQYRQWIQALLPPPGDIETKAVLKALFSGFQSLATRSLSVRTAIEVCSIIKGVEMQIRRTPGTALIEAGSGQVIYTPPETGAIARGILGG